jgi:hypothetical protein
MNPLHTKRMAAASVAALASLALAAGPAAAAAGEGPYVFDSLATGEAVTIAVGLPQALADGLAPVLGQVPGVTLEGNELQIRLASALAEMELPLVDNAPGDVLVGSDAFSLTGSLAGLVEQITGSLSCIDSPLDIVIPPGAETPLVSAKLLQAECVKDAAGRLSLANTKIADLEVNLAGALALLPAEVTGPLIEGLDTLTSTIEESVLAPIVDDVLTPIQEQLSAIVGTEIDLSEAVRIPELIDLPLVSIDLIETTTQTVTEGALIRSVATSTLAGAQLLGTVCLPDTTYRAESFVTGEPGGNDYSTAIPTVDVSICETTTLSPILRLLETDGVINDVLVNLGGGQLKPLGDLITDTGLPGELVDGLEELLATLGVSTVVQGRAVDGVRSDDGKEAGVAIQPLRIAVAPLGQYQVGTPLEGLSVAVGFGDLNVRAAGDVAPAPAPAPPPAPAPEPPVNLPRTGGGAVAAILGLAAIGGAVTLRRR